MIKTISNDRLNDLKKETDRLLDGEDLENIRKDLREMTDIVLLNCDNNPGEDRNRITRYYATFKQLDSYFSELSKLTI